MTAYLTKDLVSCAGSQKIPESHRKARKCLIYWMSEVDQRNVHSVIENTHVNRVISIHFIYQLRSRINKEVLIQN